MNINFDYEFKAPKTGEPVKMPDGSNMTVGLLFALAADHSSMKQETSSVARVKMAKLVRDVMKGGEQTISVDDAALMKKVISEFPIAPTWIIADAGDLIEGEKETVAKDQNAVPQKPDL